MSQVNDRDVEAIRDWLDKESSLPKNFDDMVLKKFLFSCHNSLARTKKCIEEFCTRRACMPEIYTNRDPLSTRLQRVFSYSRVTTYMAGVDEVLIHSFKEIPRDYDFYDSLKAFTIISDNWINFNLDVLPENHIIVVDIKLYTLALVPKVNVFYFQKFLIFVLESMPVRLKNVHVINCPSFYEYMYNLVKPVLPEQIINMIHFHPDHMGLHKFVDKKYLPKEYDGDGQSMEEQNAYWVKEISSNRNSFLPDNYWMADLSIRVKNDDTSMNGSFRTLDID